MSALDPDLLLRAYAIGVFPMSDARDAKDVYWVEPHRRAIFPLGGFRLSRSLAKTLRAGRFEVTCDQAFEEVVRRCATRDETWINDQIELGYARLHALGHAHSIECWRDGALVGGLYGVERGAAFFGESMFSITRDASKVALAWLVARLRVGGFTLLDCQFMTEHLRGLGAVEVKQADYMVLLSAAGAGVSGEIGAKAAGAGADFGALDGFLAALSEGGAPAGSSGRVIAQLLGQTS